MFFKQVNVSTVHFRLHLEELVFWLTGVETDAVQPFAGSVADTVYVPAVLTVVVFPVVPSLQANVVPNVVDAATSVTFAKLQLISV
jgi:hypothetical protein